MWKHVLIGCVVQHIRYILEGTVAHFLCLCFHSSGLQVSAVWQVPRSQAHLLSAVCHHLSYVLPVNSLKGSLLLPEVRESGGQPGQPGTPLFCLKTQSTGNNAPQVRGTVSVGDLSSA